MIGIYKITNKLNGKSYIGQSMHCGKRLDEHCKGNQFVDEIIQIDGIENFSFEVLKEVNKTELSIWEDYYIYKYNTMFPNGYNKRWNCSEDLRKMMFDSINIKMENKQNDIDDIDDIEVILCDEDLEILKRANYAQQHCFNKDRICSQKELIKFYKKGHQEALMRTKIPLNEVVLKERGNLSIARGGIYDEICNDIRDFNNGRVLWHLKDVTNPEELKLKNSENYYERQLFQHAQSELWETGLPDYTRGYEELYFSKNDIQRKSDIWDLISIKPWRYLLDNGYLNKNRIHFLNEKGENVDICKIKTKKEAEKIKKIIIS